MFISLSSNDCAPTSLFQGHVHIYPAVCFNLTFTSLLYLGPLPLLLILDLLLALLALKILVSTCQFSLSIVCQPKLV